MNGVQDYNDLNKNDLEIGQQEFNNMGDTKDYDLPYEPEETFAKSEKAIPFFKKEMVYKNPLKFKILEFRKFSSKFKGEMVGIVLMGLDGYANPYKLELTPSVKNALIDILGNKSKDWINKIILIDATTDKFAIKQQDGSTKIVQGYSLSFKLSEGR